jgi:hypothetical protein
MNTEHCTHLVVFEFDDYEVQVVKTVMDAKKPDEARSEHYGTIGNSHLYRRRK